MLGIRQGRSWAVPKCLFTPAWALLAGKFKGNVLSKATDQNISKLRMKFVGKWGLTHLSEIPIMLGFGGMS